MRLFGSIDEVLDFAIDRELEANQFYNDRAQRAENVTIKKVFENFAKEELGHKAKLEAIKASGTIIPTEKVINLKIADYVVDVEHRWETIGSFYHVSIREMEHN